MGKLCAAGLTIEGGPLPYVELDKKKKSVIFAYSMIVLKVQM